MLPDYIQDLIIKVDTIVNELTVPIYETVRIYLTIVFFSIGKKANPII